MTKSSEPSGDRTYMEFWIEFDSEDKAVNKRYSARVQFKPTNPLYDVVHCVEYRALTACQAELAMFKDLSEKWKRKYYSRTDDLNLSEAENARLKEQLWIANAGIRAIDAAEVSGVSTVRMAHELLSKLRSEVAEGEEK